VICLAPFGWTESQIALLLLLLLRNLDLHVIAYLGIRLQKPFSQPEDPHSLGLYVVLLSLQRLPLLRFSVYCNVLSNVLSGIESQLSDVYKLSLDNAL
jgi:hypothetical protein